MATDPTIVEKRCCTNENMSTLIVFAHPYPDRSQANRTLLRALDGLPDLELRSLYDLYPDYAIDADAERRALGVASTVVWQHPLFWYSVPALLKLWFEKVLTQGWAWGQGGTALRGKRCLWVVTTGGDSLDYSPAGIHRLPLGAFSASVRQTAEFCGMAWLDPIIVPQARHLDPDALAACGKNYRARLEALVAGKVAGDG